MSRKRRKVIPKNEAVRLAPDGGESNVPWSSLRSDVLCWLGLLLAGALLYGHTLHAPWYLDDTLNIVENAKIRDLSKAFGNIFKVRGPANLSFALNYWLGGLSLPGFHATNIAIHVATSGLVYLVAKRVFPGRRLYAVLTAAVFLAHPLQTQAITYIVQRYASLSAMFGFLCLYLYIRARERLASGVSWSEWRHLCWWIGALLACTLAVYSKQNLAILPLALLLFDHFYLPRPEKLSWGVRVRLIYLAPFFLPPLILALQQLAIPLAEGVPLQKIASTQEKGITPLYYLVTEFSVIWLYLRLLLVPYPQLLDYIYPTTKQLLSLQNVAAFTGLLGLMTGAFLARRRYPHLCFGVFWFLLGLAVESTLIPLDPVFEHRLYLSIFGFAVFLIGCFQYFLPEKAIVPLGLCCVLIFGGLTWRRNQMWNDDLNLYLDNLKYVTADDGFNTALTKRLIERKRYDEAIAILTKSVDAGTQKPSIYLNLSSVYRIRQEPDKAIAVINKALERGIRYPKLDINLAQAYREIKDYEKALEVYRRVIRRNPDSVPIISDFGLMLAATGRMEEAEPYLRRGLQQQPENISLKYSLSRAVAKRGALAEAETLLRQVVAANPAVKEAWFSLGVIGLQTGQEGTFREALAKLGPLDGKMAEKLAALPKVRRQ